MFGMLMEGSSPDGLPDAITTILGQSSDSIPVWVLGLILFVWMLRDPLKALIARIGAPREVTPEPATSEASGLPLQMLIELRDYVGEARHEAVSARRTIDSVEQVQREHGAKLDQLLAKTDGVIAELVRWREAAVPRRRN